MPAKTALLIDILGNKLHWAECGYCHVPFKPERPDILNCMECAEKLVELNPYDRVTDPRWKAMMLDWFRRFEAGK